MEKEQTTISLPAPGRVHGAESARVIQVIETKAIRPTGLEEEARKMIIQYWDLEGNFLAQQEIEKGEKNLNAETELIMQEWHK